MDIELDYTKDRQNKIFKILDRINGIKHKHIESDNDFIIRIKETYNPIRIYEFDETRKNKIIHL